ncbi:MAG: hypothetical protein U1E60_03075 [Reyranellaceae bacterium]
MLNSTRLSIGLVSLLVAGCSSTEDLDRRLREMAGASERDLLGGMGRIPDNSFQLNEDTRILQWRWDTSYISPGVAPVFYRPWGGWGWGWGGGIPPTLVRQGCIVEWTVTSGATKAYRWQGNGCASVSIVSTPPP